MNTYIALFRGISVGGKNPLLMKELVVLLEDLGALNIKTYIQSGNAIFRSSEKNVSQLSNRISVEVKKRRGYAPQVLVLGLDGIEKAIAENPFPEAEADPSTLHLGFLASAPENPDLRKLESLKKESERFHLTDSVFYLHAPECVGRSRLAGSVEKLLGVPMTDRTGVPCAKSGKWRGSGLLHYGTESRVSMSICPCRTRTISIVPIGV